MLSDPATKQQLIESQRKEMKRGEKEAKTILEKEKKKWREREKLFPQAFFQDFFCDSYISFFFFLQNPQQFQGTR